MRTNWRCRNTRAGLAYFGRQQASSLNVRMRVLLIFNQRKYTLSQRKYTLSQHKMNVTFDILEI